VRLRLVAIGIAAAALLAIGPVTANAAVPVVNGQFDGSYWMADCRVGDTFGRVQLHQVYDSFNGSYVIDVGDVSAQNNLTGPINAKVGFRQWRYDGDLNHLRFPPEMTGSGGSLNTNRTVVDFRTRDHDPDPPGYPDNDNWFAGYEDGIYIVYQVDEVEFDFDRNGSVDCVARFDWDPFIPLPPPTFKALGDAYATGEGAGDYSGSCRRSPNSYPALWSKYHPSARFTSLACYSAGSDQVLNSQIPAMGSGYQNFVTVTVGANDAGLPLVIRACATAGTDCTGAINGAKSYIENKLPSKLGAIYKAIHNKDWDGVIEAVGYPHLFGPAVCSSTPNLTIAEQQKLNGLVDELDAVTAYMAAASQVPKVHFIDVRDPFKSHELCSSSPWIRGGPNSSTESYNPNASGHTALFFLLAAWAG
jgi:GDSL-like Lipase/Acylhydrolase family